MTRNICWLVLAAAAACAFVPVAVEQASPACRPPGWTWPGAPGALAGATLLCSGALVLRRVRVGQRRLRHENQRLTELSQRDALTGLTNRRGCDAAMQSAWPAAGTLVLLDLDHFKPINDRWGHAAGDAVLAAAAGRLRASARQDDLVVRWGGEEFLVWMPGLVDAGAEQAVRRLLGGIAGEPFVFGDTRLAVTASAGFVSLQGAAAGAALDWQRAVELVDAALYMAKAQGRNRAYGASARSADVARALAQQALELETHWRDGRVALVTLDGPEPAFGDGHRVRATT